MQRQIPFALLILLTTALAEAEHNVYEVTFSGSPGGWGGTPGFFWDNLNGHVTPGGAARGLGSGVHSLESPCIRIDDQPVLASEFFLQLSVRASQPAAFKFLSRRYTNPDCTGSIGASFGMTELPEDTWRRYTSSYGSFLPPTVRSVRLDFEYDSLGFGFFSSYVDDVQLVNRGPEEMLENARFFDDTASWHLWWGEALAHDGAEGDLTPGVARVTGHNGSFAGIGHDCIDLTGQPYPNGAFYVSAAVKPPLASQSPPGADIYVDYFTDTNCTTRNGAKQILSDATAGEWARVEGTFTPTAGTRSLRVIIATFRATDGAVTAFDDATLYPTTLFIDDFESGNFELWSASTP